MIVWGQCPPIFAIFKHFYWSSKYVLQFVAMKLMVKHILLRYTILIMTIKTMLKMIMLSKCVDTPDIGSSTLNVTCLK